jgi:hypothetical protein
VILTFPDYRRNVTSVIKRVLYYAQRECIYFFTKSLKDALLPREFERTNYLPTTRGRAQTIYESRGRTCNRHLPDSPFLIARQRASDLKSRKSNFLPSIPYFARGKFFILGSYHKRFTQVFIRSDSQSRSRFAILPVPLPISLSNFHLTWQGRRAGNLAHDNN